MQRLKDDLEIKLEKILRVYLFAQEAYLYTEYFHNPATKEERDLISNSAHVSALSMIRHLMFRTLVNEVAKLYSRSSNDKFRLSSFIDSLSPSGHFGKIGISSAHVENWKQLLLKNEKTIDNILLLRSKLYAHTDNPLVDYSSIDISFKEIRNLLDLADSILKAIYSDVFQTGLITGSPSFDRERFIILKLLAKAEKERVEEIFNSCRKV